MLIFVYCNLWARVNLCNVFKIYHFYSLQKPQYWCYVFHKIHRDITLYWNCANVLFLDHQYYNKLLLHGSLVLYAACMCT